MKKLIIMTAAMTVLFAACEHIEDIHKKWIKDGEKVYAPKVDSLLVHNGIGRGRIMFWLLESPNVKSVDIFWDNNTDSLLVPVSPSAGRDSFAVYIPLPDERTYTLNTRTTDIFGNHSLRVLSTVTSYGTLWKSTLTNRNVGSARQVGAQFTVSWLSAGEGLVATEVRYTASDGTTQTVRTPASAASTVINDVKANARYHYRSLYVPQNSLDTCYLDWKEITDFPILLDQTQFSIAGFSSQEPSGSLLASKIIDGDENTYWCSSYSDSSLPQWIIVDMKETYSNVISIKLVKNNVNTKTVELKGSTDNITFEPLGSVLFPNSRGVTETLLIPEGKKFRYLYLNFPDWYATCATLSELYVEIK